MKMGERKFIISSSPHIHDGSLTPRIMWGVSLALLPATLVSFYAFGWDAVRVILVSMVSAVVFEAIALMLRNRRPRQAMDGSAALTGLLLGLTLPPGISNAMIMVGTFVAIIVAKQVFGGLGQNPFNPALTGRVFLLIAFPAPMTTWPLPRDLTSQISSLKSFLGLAVERHADVVTGATPLGAVKEHMLKALPHINMGDLFFGLHTPGSIGEISALAILLGGLGLLVARIINWRIPLTIIATVFAVAFLYYLAVPPKVSGMSPVSAAFYMAVFHVFAGGLMIGAFFMATDYVTSPIFPKGQIIFGIGVGLMTIIIRLWGGYPEGVSFAILLMNALVPLIDRYTMPKPFGWVDRRA